MSEVDDPFAEKPAAQRKTKNESPNSAYELYRWMVGKFEAGQAIGTGSFAIRRLGARKVLRTGQRGGELRNVVLREWTQEHKRPPSRATLDDALAIFIADAAVAPMQELHLRVAATDKRIVVDFAQPRNASCAVIDAGGWAVQLNPPDDTLFRQTASSAALPIPARGGSLEPLRERLGFGPDDDRWLLCKGWLVASMFPGVARPFLYTLGPAGSGKTSLLRELLSILDPIEEVGGSFGKNLRDDIVRATNRYYFVADNITRMSDEAQNLFCRFVTGGMEEFRALYSDGEAHTVETRTTGGITGVSQTPLRNDTMERIIPLHLSRIDESDRRSELQMREEFTRQHPLILGALFDLASETLARLPEARRVNRKRQRMADFDDLLYAVDPAISAAYARSCGSAMRDAAEGDPFVTTMVDWLASGPVGTASTKRGEVQRGVYLYRPDAERQPDEWTYTNTPAETYNHVNEFRKRMQGYETGQWWPSSARRFSQMVSAELAPALLVLGVTATVRRGSGGTRLLTLRYVRSGDASGDATPADGLVAQPATPLATPPTSQVTPLKRSSGDGGDATCGASYLTLQKEETGQGRDGEMPASCVTSATTTAGSDGGAHAEWPNPHGLPVLDGDGQPWSALAWLFANAALSDDLPLHHLIEDLALGDDDSVDETTTPEELVTILEEEGVPQRVTATVRRLFGIEEEDDE